MQEPPILSDVSEEFQTVLKWVLSGVIEAFFLACWVLTQWAVDEYVVSRFKMDGIDAITLTIAQWLFGIATLVPILFRLIRLFGTMAIRTYRDIQREWKKN